MQTASADPSRPHLRLDLAGFGAVTDVHGDASALGTLELFEGMVGEALAENAPPVKWIGDGAMLAFTGPRWRFERWASSSRPAGRRGPSGTDSIPRN